MYDYAVYSVNDIGAVSTFSLSVYVPSDVCDSTDRPGDFTAYFEPVECDGNDEGQIWVHWTPSSDSTGEYLLFELESGSWGTQHAGIDGTSSLEKGLEPGDWYQWVIRSEKNGS